MQEYYDVCKNIKDDIKEMIAESGETKSIICRRAGMRPQAITQISNAKNFTIKTVYRIARALGYEMEVHFVKVESKKEGAS